MPNVKSRPGQGSQAKARAASRSIPAGVAVFPHAEANEQEAGRWCRSLLESWSVEPAVCAQAMPVVSELLSNATRHGSGSVQVELELRGGRIWVGVRDDGPGPMRTEGVFPPQGGAHGLGRIAQVSHVWGVSRHPGGGTTVWSELDR
jgi:serine/threonine-protein kinase RsbW